MLSFSRNLLKLRPREIPFSPPPLIRRPGKFKCKVCHHTWVSENVWVTQTTRKCYQGETCNGCGSTTKPFYVGHWERDVFNTEVVDRRPRLGRHIRGLNGHQRR